MSKRKIIMASVIAALTFICAGCGNLDANANMAVPVKENLIIDFFFIEIKLLFRIAIIPSRL